MVTDHSERGLANWISDRIWAHLLNLAGDIEGVNLVEKGVTREVIVGLNYRLRVKRHAEDGRVASYETPTFMEFVTQDDGNVTLEGFEEIRLIAGYEWDKDKRDIGDPVLSLRDGKDNVKWQEKLPDVADEDEGGGATVVTPQQPQPPAPTVDIPDEIGQAPAEPTEEG